MLIKNWIENNTPLNHLVLGDCMEGMAQFPDNYFDLACTDPPYNLKKSSLTYGHKISSSGVKRFNTSKWKEWNHKEPPPEYFTELKRISKNQIIWGVNNYQTYLGKGRIVWHKENTATFSDCELAYQSITDGVYYFKYTWNGMIQENMKNKETRIHPTQKPVQLYKWILHNYAKPDFKIIDTHVGSGSSIIAFLDFGCDWIGFEKDKDHHADASERIEIHKQQLKLF